MILKNYSFPRYDNGIVVMYFLNVLTFERFILRALKF
jgi:hypothetical protein